MLGKGLVAARGQGAPDDWLLTARDAQLPPLGDWSVWLFLGGRGCGKTHALSAAVHTAARAGVPRIHFVGPTASDLYDVNIFGPSGIMKTAGRGPVPRWIPSKRRLEWPNGSTCVFFSAEEPETLRGPQASICCIDEIGRMRQQAEVFDQATMGLRLGAHPRMLIATTPRPTPLIKKLVKQDRVFDDRVAPLAGRSAERPVSRRLDRARCCPRRAHRASLSRRRSERAYQAGKRATNMIRVKEVTASRGKVMRAEPISLAYEKQRVVHRNGLDQLESEMLSFSREWNRDVDGSPNRLDACVWVLTRLSKIIVDLPMA
jgi:phage terminase large subunit-like protein